jgi:hypothetical protein
MQIYILGNLSLMNTSPSLGFNNTIGGSTKPPAGKNVQKRNGDESISPKPFLKRGR